MKYGRHEQMAPMISIKLQPPKDIFLREFPSRIIFHKYPVRDILQGKQTPIVIDKKRFVVLSSFQMNDDKFHGVYRSIERCLCERGDRHHLHGYGIVRPIEEGFGVLSRFFKDQYTFRINVVFTFLTTCLLNPFDFSALNGLSFPVPLCLKMQF